MIGKVRFSDCKQTREITHHIEVHPKTAHCIVHGRVNGHRVVIGITPSDLFVHIEEITVSFANSVFTHTLNSISNVQIYA